MDQIVTYTSMLLVKSELYIRVIYCSRWIALRDNLQF